MSLSECNAGIRLCQHFYLTCSGSRVPIAILPGKRSLFSYEHRIQLIPSIVTDHSRVGPRYLPLAFSSPHPSSVFWLANRVKTCADTKRYDKSYNEFDLKVLSETSVSRLLGRRDVCNAFWLSRETSGPTSGQSTDPRCRIHREDVPAELPLRRSSII